MHPFRIEIPDSQLADLRQRIASTRWPAVYSGAGWERGTPLGYLKELAGYWLNEYDWRAAERELNQYPQFITEIDGQKVHFLHITSAVPGAKALVLTHSWPGSMVEFLDMIGPLTDPAAHGGDPADAFHLVIPSIPGYGFSGPVTEAGWDITRVGRAWAELMRRLGYDSYLTGGGDWGTLISLEVARADPEHVKGIHLTWPIVPSRDAIELAKMSEEDLANLDKVSMSWPGSDLAGYLHLQTTRPLTVSYALQDSPVGLLSWIVEKFYEWNKLAKTPEDVLSRDRLLTNVSIYWLTETMGSSLQLYIESGMALGGVFTPGVPSEPIRVPIAVVSFTHDPAPPLRPFGGLESSTIRRWSTLEGGHLGPLEQPEQFVSDLRAFARSLDT